MSATVSATDTHVDNGDGKNRYVKDDMKSYADDINIAVKRRHINVEGHCWCYQ